MRGEPDVQQINDARAARTQRDGHEKKGTAGKPRHLTTHRHATTREQGEIPIVSGGVISWSKKYGLFSML